MHYTEEQIEAARHVKIARILDDIFESYKRCGKEYYWVQHDSVKFHDNIWFQHSTGKGGSTIEFCERFLNLNFEEAVRYLTDTFIGNSIDISSDLSNNGSKVGDTEPISIVFSHEPINIQEEDEALNQTPVVPVMAKNQNKAFIYLTKNRGIEPSTVSFFIDRKEIMETADYHNVAFIGKDMQGITRNISLRSTGNQKRFRINVANSDSHYGFSYYGDGEKIYVFESAIDMLSFITMHPDNWKENSYVALNGISGNALFKALNERKNLQTIILCLDNDLAGNDACEKICDGLGDRGYEDVYRLKSRMKDWNEDLMKIREQNNNNKSCISNLAKGEDESCHQLQFLS